MSIVVPGLLKEQFCSSAKAPRDFSEPLSAPGSLAAVLRRGALHVQEKTIHSPLHIGHGMQKSLCISCNFLRVTSCQHFVIDLRREDTCCCVGLCEDLQIS